MRNIPITGSTHILCVGLRVNSTIPVSWYSDRQDLYHALLVCFSPVSILCHEQRSQTSVRCVLEILPQRVDIATKNKCYLNDSIISSNLLTTWVFPSIPLKERRGKHNFLTFSDWTIFGVLISAYRPYYVIIPKFEGIWKIKKKLVHQWCLLYV